MPSYDNDINVISFIFHLNHWQYITCWSSLLESLALVLYILLMSESNCSDTTVHRDDIFKE